MKKILFSLSCLLIIFACGEMAMGEYGAYPKEFKQHQLPPYPNVIDVSKSESTPLGDDGDIQMAIKFTTADDLKTIKNFYSSKLKDLGYKENQSTQLQQLQEKGAPFDESNFYSGSFQNIGKVFNISAIERNDTVGVNITFMGS